MTHCLPVPVPVFHCMGAWRNEKHLKLSFSLLADCCTLRMHAAKPVRRNSKISEARYGLLPVASAAMQGTRKDCIFFLKQHLEQHFCK